MKFSRKRAICALLLAGAAAQAELADWVQHIEGGSLIESIFFRTVNLPSGPVPSRKPPNETVAELTRQIAASPQNLELLRYRALEYETLLNFKAAEADWKRIGLVELADFYHRRLQPKDELATLLQAAQKDASAPLYERAIALAQSQAMPADTTQGIYRAWISRDPKNSTLYSRLFEYLASNGRPADAEAVLNDYARAFPNSPEFVMQGRAYLARKRGSAEQALAVYDKAFEPLWPASLVSAYFEVLKETRSLRRFLSDARAKLAANPGDLNAAVRLFYYYQQAGNLPEAHRALKEYSARKTQWAPQELFTLGQLFEQTQNFMEAARHYQRLDDERGAAGIARVLFTAPDQAMQIGQGDLTFYKDIATMDPGPGTLNGILSLLFNSTEPRMQFSEQERKAQSYFARAKAAELLTEFDRKYPQSKERSHLHAKLIGAYATHGASEGVIRSGRQYLASFPDSPYRTEVALHMADAFARGNQVKEEFAVYDALLKELGIAAGGIPLGSISDIAPHEQMQRQQPEGEGERRFQPPAIKTPARSQEYANVLDRYLARLASMKRVKEALLLYRTEIDRNPKDPALYERLSAFLDQNKMAADVEQVYQKAMQQFQDRNWHHKLARWYLRNKRSAQFGALTQEVVKVFSGTELERYFSQVVNGAPVDDVLYRQLNLYANQRFPHDLVFVRNLLDSYSRKTTLDLAARERLLRAHWFYAPDLRSQYFELLSRTNRLNAELSALQAANINDRAVTQFIAEARNWQSHFEQAQAPLSTAATAFPGDAALNTRAASLQRSLGNIDAAAAIEHKLSQIDPRNSATLARIGEIYADKEQFAKAKPFWNRIAAIDPGRADGYLEAATVYWDYYQFDDALRVIAEGRARMKQPELLSYEAGAIYENRREYSKAIDEYLKGALASTESPSFSRLLNLARRPAHRDAIEQQTRQLASGASPAPAAFALRLAVLENGSRRAEIEQYLTSLAAATSSFELLSRIDETAARLMLPNVRRQSLERQIAITPDPVEKTGLRIELAKHHEAQNNLNAARQQFEALLKDSGQIVGVVRSATNFYWRTKDQRRAVDTLVTAAQRANADWKRKLTLEAAVKATDSNDPKRARGLLEPVLAAEPLAPDAISAMAAVYAKEGDDKGLRAFFNAKLQAAPADRKPELRRALIPVDTRLQDYADAIAQYIEILNKFPEDQALIQESISYARTHGRREQLVNYYVKAAQDSPKDARWTAILARLHTGFENYPAAIEAYNRATSVRPDRTDLHIARATLEERLLRFDEAAKSYAQIYNLTYKDPRWMVKVAETRARQQRRDEVIAALRAAYLDGRTARAEDYFAAARLLESWRMLPQAKEFADSGLKLAASSPIETDDLRFYLRLSTRLRQQEQAWAALTKLSQDHQSFVMDMANEVKIYFTPEEKSAFAAWLVKLRTAHPGVQWVDVAMAAGLQDTAVRWMVTAMTAEPTPENTGQYLHRLIETQQRRLQFDPLAVQLEAIYKASPAEARAGNLAEVARNFRLAGSTNNELRVLTLMDQQNVLGGFRDRYHRLLLTRAPEELVAQAGKGLDSAVQIAMSGSDPALALRAVTARGAVKRPAVWTHAYTALAGLYFGRSSQDIDAAFQSALGSSTAGEQLGRKVNRDEQLAGDIWFYYGSRYGEWLDLAGKNNAEDYLPAVLEDEPESAKGYVQLADYYVESKKPAKALIELEHAMQFAPGDGALRNKAAEVLAAEGKLDPARQRWKEALAAFDAVQNRGFAPESFWSDVQHTLDAIGRYKSLPAVRAEADKLLRTYFRRNGYYRVEPLLRGALNAAADPLEGTRWIVDLAGASAEPAAFLGNLAEERWMPDAGRAIVYERTLELSDQNVARAEGPAKEQAISSRRHLSLRYIERLLDAKQPAQAQAVLARLANDPGEHFATEMAAAEIRIAAQTDTLPRLLARFDEPGAPVPASEVLRNAAAAIRRDGDAADARRLLEWLYTRELNAQDLTPANFLGLAEVKLEAGDAAAAVALLRRMALVAGEPFADLPAAATLLERFQRSQEAREFRDTYAKAVPWDFVNVPAPELAALPEAPYALRAAAALQAKGRAPANLPAELALLASATPADPAAAEKALYFFSRVEAAKTQQDPGVRVRLLRAAVEIDPDAQQPRIDLVRAAMEAKRPVLATSSLYAMLYNSGLRYRLDPRESEDGADRPEPDDEASSLAYWANEFLNGFALTPAERAKIARDLASAYREVDKPTASQILLRLSSIIDPQVNVEPQIAALAAERKAQKANELRRPKVHQGLEQERPVRPRLPATNIAGGAR